MRVLVTGARGALAPFVIRALWDRHVVVLLWRRPPQAGCAALPRIQGDITVFDHCWRAVQGMDAVQHLAAQPWPVAHPRLREQAAAQAVPFGATFQSTMLGTYDLIPAAVAAGGSAW
jgi:nucleoside-diphosphate-sugar epimerase